MSKAQEKLKQEAAPVDNIAMTFAKLQRAVVEMEICFAINDRQGLVTSNKLVYILFQQLGNDIVKIYKGDSNGKEEPHVEEGQGRNEGTEEQSGNEAKS